MVNKMHIEKSNNIFQYLEKNYNEFTNTQKRFVRYIIANRFEVPFLSAYNIAGKIKADSSTLIRFVKGIGYKGYPEFRKDLGKFVIEEMRLSGQLNKAKNYKNHKEKNIIQISLNKSYENVLNLINNTDYRKIKEFSGIIFSARKKIIVANRSSYSVGHFLYFELKKIVPNVQFLNNYDYGYYDIFPELNEKDVVIAIGIPRYTSATIEFAQYAYEREITVISVTDSHLSPLYQISKLSLLANTQSATFHNSNVTLMALTDAVIAGVFSLNREKAIKRLEKEEKILKDKKIIFYEKK